MGPPIRLIKCLFSQVEYNTINGTANNFFPSDTPQKLVPSFAGYKYDSTGNPTNLPVDDACDVRSLKAFRLPILPHVGVPSIERQCAPLVWTC